MKFTNVYIYSFLAIIATWSILSRRTEDLIITIYFKLVLQFTISCLLTLETLHTKFGLNCPSSSWDDVNGWRQTPTHIGQLSDLGGPKICILINLIKLNVSVRYYKYNISSIGNFFFIFIFSIFKIRVMFLVLAITCYDKAKLIFIFQLYFRSRRWFFPVSMIKIHRFRVRKLQNIYFPFLSHLSHSDDLLLWVGVRRGATCLNIFSRTIGPIFTKFKM